MRAFLRFLFLIIFTVNTPLIAMEEVEQPASTTAKKKPVVLLSLEGGGTRGIGSVKILQFIFEELAKELGRVVIPVEVFDLFGGTSVGGIISLMLASGKTLEDCYNLFWEHSKTIFSDAWFGWPPRYGGYLWKSKYASHGLETVLKQTFGEAPLSDIQKPVFVTTYCPGKNQFFLLDSQDSTQFPNTTIAQAARATTAAPTYFSSPPLITSTQETLYVQDGGVGANDPGQQVLAEAKKNHPNHHCLAQAQKHYPKNRYFLISIGTGQSPPSEMAHDQGLLTFGPDAVSDVMNAARAATETALATELGKHHYFRLQFESDLPLDTTDPTLLRGIEAKAAALVDTDVFKRLIKKLAKTMRKRESAS